MEVMFCKQYNDYKLWYQNGINWKNINFFTNDLISGLFFQHGPLG